jgi:3-oxoacyl-[acyl-carrier protein] reductase
MNQHTVHALCPLSSPDEMVLRKIENYVDMICGRSDSAIVLKPTGVEMAPFSSILGIYGTVCSYFAKEYSMDLGLKDRVAVVTGGSRGLGRQIALSLGREGCKLAIFARTSDQVSETVSEFKDMGYSIIGWSADVMKPMDCERIVEETIVSYGKIDILVNNAGGVRGGLNFDDTTDQDWQGSLDLNLMSAVRLSRLVLPGMKERQWGRIINISSIWGREYGGVPTYMVSKAGLIAFSNSLAREVASHGVLVNCIAPGSIKFPGGAWERFEKTKSPELVQDFIKQQFPMGQFGWPEPVGDMVAFLASDRADLVTGTTMTVDGGQSRSLI